MSSLQLAPVLANPIVSAAAAIFVLVVVVYAVARLILRWRAARDLEPNEPPPLLIPVQRRGSEAPRAPLRSVLEGPTAPLAAGLTSAGNGANMSLGYSPGGGQRYGTPPGGNGSAAALANSAPAMASAPSRANGAAAASKVVHEIPPMDGTLQFLPGRLEVVDGESPGRDIRFVRTWGEIPEITFGRVTGPPYRHVQLRSQTVSRQHARMQYVDGRWKLTNLSQTNPVLINGQALDSAHGHRVLRDGDQIEMGEVVFRYRER
jgi:FHA domain-containing protein